MSLLFNTLSRFLMAFLSRSNCLLISLLQSQSTVIMESRKIKFVTAYTFSPSICHEVMGPEIKLPTSIGSWRKQESSRKTSTSALLTMPKPLTVCITTNWKILKEMGIPDYLTCLLRNMYAGQEATVRNGHGTTDWFQIRKGICQACILSPCLFNLYAEYILRNPGLEEAQAGIKIAGRNINNLRYADDTTLMAESEEELNSLLMKVKEKSENVGLKLNIQKTKIMASSPITSWQIDGERVQNSERLYYFGLQNHCRW